MLYEEMVGRLVRGVAMKELEHEYHCRIYMEQMVKSHTKHEIEANYMLDKNLDSDAMMTLEELLND